MGKMLSEFQAQSARQKKRSERRRVEHEYGVLRAIEHDMYRQRNPAWPTFEEILLREYFGLSEHETKLAICRLADEERHDLVRAIVTNNG
jgi:hypothetical protein